MESGPEVTRDEIVAVLADRDAAHAALLAAKDAEIAAKDALISQLAADRCVGNRCQEELLDLRQAAVLGWPERQESGEEAFLACEVRA